MDLDTESIQALSLRSSNDAAKATKLIVDFLNHTHTTNVVSGKTIKVVKFTPAIIEFLEGSILENNVKEEKRWNSTFNQAQVSDIIDTLMKYDFLSKLNVQSFVVVARILLLSEDCLAVEQGLFRMMDTLRSRPQGRKGDTSAAYGFKLHVGEGFLWVLVEYLSMPRSLRLKRWALCLLNELCLGCGQLQLQLASDKRGQSCFRFLVTSTTRHDFGHDVIAQISLISMWSMILQHVDMTELRQRTGIVWEGFQNIQLRVLESTQFEGSVHIEPLTETWFQYMIEWLKVTGCCQSADSRTSPIIWLPQIISLNDDLFSLPEDGIHFLSLCAKYLSIYTYDTASHNLRFLDVPYENVVSCTCIVPKQGSPFTEVKLELEDFIEGFTYLDNLEQVEEKGTLSLFFKTEELPSFEEKVRSVCTNIDIPPRSSMPGGVQYVFMHNATTETQLQKRRGEVAKNMTSSPTKWSQNDLVSSPGQEKGLMSDASVSDQDMNNYEVSNKIRGQTKSNQPKYAHQNKNQGITVKTIKNSLSDLEIPDTRTPAISKTKGKLKDRMVDEDSISSVKNGQKKSGKRDEVVHEQEETTARAAKSTRVRDEFDFQCTDDEDDNLAALKKSKGKAKGTVTTKTEEKKSAKSASKKAKTSKPKLAHSTELEKKTTKTPTARSTAHKGKKALPKKDSVIVDDKDDLDKLDKVSTKKAKTVNEPTRRSGRRAAAQKADERISDVVQLERQDTQVIIPDDFANENHANGEDEVSDEGNNNLIDTTGTKPKRGRPKKQTTQKTKNDVVLHTVTSTLLERVESKRDENKLPSRELQFQTIETRKGKDIGRARAKKADTKKGIESVTTSLVHEANDEQHDSSDEIDVQTKITNKNQTSRRRFEITESGSPVSSQHQDNYVDNDTNFPSPIVSPLNLSPEVKLHEGFHSKTANHILNNNNLNPSNKVQEQTNVLPLVADQVGEDIHQEQDWHNDDVEHAGEVHLEQADRHGSANKSSPSKVIDNCNIVVEQVARISPRNIPNVELIRPAIEGFAKSVIELCQTHVQEGSHSGHLDVMVPFVPAQHKQPNYQFVKSKGEEVRSNPTPIEPAASKPCLGNDIAQKLSELSGSNKVTVFDKGKDVSTGAERITGVAAFQTDVSKSRPTHDKVHQTGANELPAYPVSRLWEAADDDPDRTLVPTSDNEMGCDEEEGEFATESPLAAKVKPSILNNDPYVTKIPKLPVFNIDVPTSISQAMIRIMDYHTQLLMRPQEKAQLMLENYRVKGKEIFDKFDDHYRAGCTLGQHEIHKLEQKYKDAVKKGYDDVYDVETKMASAEIRAKIQEQDAQMDKLMQSAMQRFGVA